MGLVVEIPCQHYVSKMQHQLAYHKCFHREAEFHLHMRQISTKSFIRLIQRNNVDLPQPDGPIKAVTWPLGIFMLILLSACFSP